ncbi:MAG TPA: TPM domain-containing protein [Candidatus Binatia bacterium]|nr:TPM domain-containing protein [Candidatus Binatia bacterium]
MLFIAALFFTLLSGSLSSALEMPPLKTGINDFAAMFPPASLDDLETRLRRFNTETANGIVVLTLKTLDGKDIDSVALSAFNKLPLSDAERQRTVLLVVARSERQVSVHAGSQVRALLPEPAASQKLLAQATLYWDGLRPDLGIHGAVHYLFRVLRGDVRVGSQTEEEKLEEMSLRGGEAGAIFALCLGPFLAFFVAVLWGIYATQYGVQRNLRLLIGAIFGGATAKIVGILMSVLGGYTEGLWYFIMALAIPLGVFGSLTEFWMAGDWRGIPRVKDRKRKPEDNMGI